MSQLNQGRPLAMQNLPSSTAQDYRHYAYNNPAGAAGSIPFTQANPSNISVATSFPAESSAKFGNPSYSYANYVPQ